VQGWGEAVIISKFSGLSMAELWSTFEKNFNGKRSILIKILIVSLILFVLLFGSETLYIIKNGSPSLTRYLVDKSQKSARKENAQTTLSALSVAAKINIFPQAFEYRGLIPIKYNPRVNLPEGNSQLKEAWLIYIKNLDLNLSSESALARIFYTLGLLAYRNSESDLVIPLWQTAVYLEPELSHYHVELANFYLASADQEKAKYALEFCLKFKFPVKHCQEYIDNSLSKNIPEEVGFLEKGLEEYDKSIGS